jgi:transposase
MNAISYVGLDVHKESIVVALVKPGERKAVEWKMRNTVAEVRKLGRRLLRESGRQVKACYEAGPCGYGILRQLQALGVDCVVVAPSLIPIKPGERVKTDRRDARKLATYLRDGSLTEVRPPTEAEEAVRDVCRAREDVREDLMRSRHRLSKMLLRRGLRYPGRSTWGTAHRQWLKTICFEHEGERVVFGDYLFAVEQLEERLKALEAALEAQAMKEPYRERVGWLLCFRGIKVVTAMTILTELHGFERFTKPRELMGYLGLVSSEDSSGKRTHRGGITKTGNQHARRILVECAWHYRSKPAVRQTLLRRRAGQPAWVISIADKAQQRLNRRYWHLVLGNKKAPQKAVVAVARELVGFIWALLQGPSVAASGRAA